MATLHHYQGKEGLLQIGRRSFITEWNYRYCKVGKLFRKMGYKMVKILLESREALYS